MLMNAALILLFFQGKKFIFTKIAQFIHSTMYGYLCCSIFGGIGPLYEKYSYMQILG